MKNFIKAFALFTIMLLVTSCHESNRDVHHRHDTGYRTAPPVYRPSYNANHNTDYKNNSHKYYKAKAKYYKNQAKYNNSRKASYGTSRPYKSTYNKPYKSTYTPSKSYSRPSYSKPYKSSYSSSSSYRSYRSRR